MLVHDCVDFCLDLISLKITVFKDMKQWEETHWHKYLQASNYVTCFAFISLSCGKV